ncbi:MAG: patatin-like phospholipase family protein, partial [Gammaproteobacteria bacterium]
MKCSPDTALILTGGGARGAYQAGVLKAIAEQFPGLHDPFPILCGSSAGALNAVGLASGPGIFRHGVERLEHLWETVTADRVYRHDLW